MGDIRYPYTYACDFIRSLAGYDKDGNTRLSRSDASQIMSGIAGPLGMDDSELAAKLADYFLAHEGEIAEKRAADWLRLMGRTT